MPDCIINLKSLGRNDLQGVVSSMVRGWVSRRVDTAPREGTPCSSGVEGARSGVRRAAPATSRRALLHACALIPGADR